MEANRSEKQQRFDFNLIQANNQLYYYALQLTENYDDALDLVQETNYKALRHFSRLKYDEHQKAWLYTILRNTHINNLRSGHKKNMKIVSDENESIFAASLPTHDQPDRVFDRKELKEQIRNLPGNYAKPLKLFLAGYSYKEIAHMTSAPIGTIKSRIHLAKEKLKKHYHN